MAVKLLSVGALTLDTVYQVDQIPAEPGKFLSHGAKTMAAGMASSAAVAASRLGAMADIWASVGDDWAGRALLEEMNRLGVGTEHVRRIAGVPSAIAAIFNDAAGERLVVVNYDKELLSAPEQVPAIDRGGYSAVLVDVRWPAAARAALDAARTAGVPGVLDADTGDAAVLKDLAGRASHIVASEGGAALLCGQTDPADAVRAIQQTYGVFTAVTAGGKGVFFMGADGALFHQPVPAVEVVDTNAAGDVFHGAFALALSEGQTERDMMRFASAAAAIKCTRFGGILGAPERGEVEALLPRVPEAVVLSS